jgi:predicted amidophosphoribosyltransferase
MPDRPNTALFTHRAVPFDTRLLGCAHCLDKSISVSKMALTSYALCGTCHRLFTQSLIVNPSSYGFFDPIAFFSYESLMKRWIHRAKIANEEKSRTLLLELFTNSAASLWGQWCDVVIASPSSLWGRLRGRINLAGYLAHAMAVKHRKPLLDSPLLLQGRLQKRAQQHKINFSEGLRSSTPWTERLWATVYQKTDQSWVKKFNHISPKPFKVLIIDDVYTTGQTLQETAQKVESLLVDKPLQICKLALCRTPLS